MWATLDLGERQRGHGITPPYYLLPSVVGSPRTEKWSLPFERRSGTIQFGTVLDASLTAALSARFSWVLTPARGSMRGTEVQAACSGPTLLMAQLLAGAGLRVLVLCRLPVGGVVVLLVTCTGT